MNPGTVQSCTDRGKVEVFEPEGPEGTSSHPCAPQRDRSSSLCSKDLLPVAIPSGNKKPAGRDIPAQSANRIYIAATLAFLDASLSPTSLAEQPPSSCALRMTLCAWGSPLPPGRSAWPIVLSEQG